MFKRVHGVILVFDYTSRKSFKSLDYWLDYIKLNINNDAVVVLFGNKIDIEKEKWEVTREEAKEYATKNNLMLFETSAKLNQGLKEGCSYIVNKAYSVIEKKIIENNNNNVILKNEKKTNEKCVGKKSKK